MDITQCVQWTDWKDSNHPLAGVAVQTQHEGWTYSVSCHLLVMTNQLKDREKDFFRMASVGMESHFLIFLSPWTGERLRLIPSQLPQMAFTSRGLVVAATNIGREADTEGETMLPVWAHEAPVFAIKAVASMITLTSIGADVFIFQSQSRWTMKR